MKWILPCLLLLFPGVIMAQAFNTEYTALLQRHVTKGLVNYRELCKDPALNQYVSRLSGVNPDALSAANDRFAFWINAYNAYTLKVICDNYPVKSINELHTGGRVLGHVLKTTVWDKDFVVVNGRKTTLNHIEHEIIRPVFKDPRAHFALVCASASCPPLSTEAFEGARLDDQLDDAARTFLNDPARNRFDPAKKKAAISKIFDWYGKDFGKNEKEILLYLGKFLQETARNSIQANAGEWEISYLDYDWSLNGS